MPGKHKDHAKLKRLWLSGKFTSLRHMAEELAKTDTPVSLTNLKHLSARKNWTRDRAKVAPKIEERAVAKMVERESTRLSRIDSKIVELQEILLDQTLKPLKNKKLKMTVEEALKGVRSIAELQARIIGPKTGRLQHGDAPTGESPAAAALAQVSVTVNTGQPAVAAAPGDEDFGVLSDEDLADAVNAGKGIIIDERPTARAKIAAPAKVKPKPKKAPKT